ncbi:MAG: ATP-binding cassette domain-containing protein [Actinobacteria bacterium]|nr:ATP-binding cassette domain-containing protein [Actinomycetota bacterium]
MNAPPLFELVDVRVERGGRTILRVDELSIADGSPTAIIGPSGSGKSTLLRLLNRLDVATAGRVFYRGGDLLARDPLAHRRDVAMVFQRPIALDGSVRDNLCAAQPKLDAGRAVRLLERVGLDGSVLEQSAASLSGGELQRVSIARSLATDPTVLLLDEATSALDPANTQLIEELVAGLSHDSITPIWVTHNPQQMRRVASQVVVVIDGVVRQAGTAEQVLGTPDLDVARFLGEGSP